MREYEEKNSLQKCISHRILNSKQFILIIDALHRFGIKATSHRRIRRSRTSNKRMKLTCIPECYVMWFKF